MPTERKMSRMSGWPLLVDSRATSWIASSRRFVAASVTWLGVPSGKITFASMSFASSLGKMIHGTAPLAVRLSEPMNNEIAVAQAIAGCRRQKSSVGW